MRFVSGLAGLAGLLLTVSGVAHANPNLVQNGSFEQSTRAPNTEFGASYGGQILTGWSSASSSAYNLYWSPTTATTVSAASRWGGEQLLAKSFTGASPDGGNFVSMDGDASVRGALTQTISNLVVGNEYEVSFYWGATQLTNRTGTTTEQLEVSLGGQDAFTPVVTNPSQGFSGWLSQSLDFKATSATEVLSFLSVGTPTGLPPMAVLDGVSMTQVPEPASLVLLGGAVAGLLAMRRRRRS